MDNINILDKDGQPIFNKDDIEFIGLKFSDERTASDGYNKHSFTFRSPTAFSNFDVLKSHLESNYIITVKSDANILKSGSLTMAALTEYHNVNENYYQLALII